MTQTAHDRESSTSLGLRAAEGGLWLVGSKAVQQAAGLAQAAVLAHYLSPWDFGVFGIANITIYAAGVFVYTGFECAIIQRPAIRKSDIDTTWWVLLGRYVALMILLLALAYPIAAFFKSPEAVPVLLAVALIQPLHGLAGPSLFLLRREMRFRTVLHIEAGGAILGLIAGVAAAVLLRSVWALVAAYAAGACGVVVLSYLLHPARPGSRFDPRSARELLSYGQWLTGSSIVGFLCSQAAGAFSGWMFGVGAMGVYQMAARFSLTPMIQLSDALQAALAPAFASVQSEAERVRAAFVRSARLLLAVEMSLVAVLFVSLRWLVPLLLGEQWSEAAVLAPWIALAAGAQVLVRSGQGLYLGTGFPRYQFLIDLTQAVTLTAVLYPLGRTWGMVGLPLALILAAMSALPVWWWGIRRAARCSPSELLGAAGPPGAALAVMIAVSQAITGFERNGLLAIAAPLLSYVAVLLSAGRIVPRYHPAGDLISLFSKRVAFLRGIVRAA